MTQFIFQDEVTICLVEAVREFFGTNALSRDYQWSADKNGRLIDIVDAWGEEEVKYPNIIVNSLAGGAEEHLGFGDVLERLKNNGQDIGQYYGASIGFDVNFQIASYSRRETHRVSDLLMLGLMKDVPERIATTSLGNLLLEPPFVRMGGEGQQPLSDETVVYTRVLSQRWRSFWKTEVVYSDEILAYLTTAEREKIDGGTMTVQFKANGV